MLVLLDWTGFINTWKWSEKQCNLPENESKGREEKLNREGFKSQLRTNSINMFFPCSDNKQNIYEYD